MNQTDHQVIGDIGAVHGSLMIHELIHDHNSTSSANPKKSTSTMTVEDIVHSPDIRQTNRADNRETPCFNLFSWMHSW